MTLPEQAEGQAHLPQWLLAALFVTQAGMVLALKGVFLAHVQPVGHQDPQVLVCKAAFWLIGPQPVLLHWVLLRYKNFIKVYLPIFHQYSGWEFCVLLSKENFNMYLKKIYFDLIVLDL